MSNHRRSPVTRPSLVAPFALAVLTTGAALAQGLPRSFEASPDIYNVIAEDARYRVIAVTWKPGQRDQLHSHPASAVYYLTDCSVRVHLPDGTFRDYRPPAGTAIVQAPIPGHALENTGTSDCKIIIFEPS
jgi:quercetin dioxygenase-like cupin family protein